MQWANWMSLGIIVSLFTCMVQRLASSMRLAIYASAASCRYMIALPWKCRSYLPTSWAISWTNCKKGSFQIRSSVLFWNCWISWRATVPGWYFLVIFTFPAWRNSFWGGFASHGWLELPPDCLLLTWCRWPSLCSHLGQLSCWQLWRWPSDPLKLLCLCNSLHNLLSLRRSLFSWSRGCTSDEHLLSLVSTFIAALIHSTVVSAPLFPWWGVIFVLAILQGN